MLMSVAGAEAARAGAGAAAGLVVSTVGVTTLVASAARRIAISPPGSQAPFHHGRRHRARHSLRAPGPRPRPTRRLRPVRLSRQYRLDPAWKSPPHPFG